MKVQYLKKKKSKFNENSHEDLLTIEFKIITYVEDVLIPRTATRDAQIQLGSLGGMSICDRINSSSAIADGMFSDNKRSGFCICSLNNCNKNCNQ